MKVGVLGANGFVGRNICLKFLEYNSQVIAFYHKNKSSIPDKCNKIHYSKYPEYHLDILIIAIGGHDSNYEHFLEQNRLIDDIVQSSNYDMLIFISSTEVYGESSKIISVNSCFNNPGIYGQSKIAQEFLIKSTNNYIIIRPTYLFGDGMNTDSLIPLWLKTKRDKNEIVIYGNGERKQDYLHIDDLSELCYRSSLESGKSEIVLAATGHSYSNLNIAKVICSSDNDCNIVYFGEDDKLSSNYDISSTISKYEFTPRTSIKEWLKANI
jgi:UDP-glucose 4-epimerase